MNDVGGESRTLRVRTGSLTQAFSRTKRHASFCLWAHWLSVFVLLAAWAHLSTATVAQDAARPFREAVSVNVETQVVKTLETAREHMTEGQWEQAVPILQQLIDASGDTLVPMETGRYWNTGSYCHLLISLLPASGLEAYRSRVDGQAREWFEAGQNTLDEALLKRVVDTAFNSSFGDDALWLLGELAFERGQFAHARQYWQLLVPSVAPAADDAEAAPADAVSPAPVATGYLTYPDSSLTDAEVLARLVLCSTFEGDRERAEAELTVFQSRYPDASGELAGRSGRMAKLLGEMLVASRQWTITRTSGTDLCVPGGQPDRHGRPGGTPRTQELIWQRPLPRNRFPGPTKRTLLGVDDHSSFFPLIHNNTVFTCDSDSIFAFDLETGRPKWPLDGDDDARIFTNILERPLNPHLPSAGIAWYTMSLSEGRLYARMGPPIMRRSRNEGNAFSEIVGLDVSHREGELVFHATSDVLDPETESPEATSWSFEGTPLVSHGRVYVSARRGSPEDEVVVACFDADSSRLLWRRRVCASLKNASDRFNLIGQNMLTLGDGRLFLATGTGAIVALDAETGRLLWVVTYESSDEETVHELSDSRRHGLTPCVFHGGVVYVAPADSDLVYALDATAGQLVWRQQYPDRVLHIPGVVEGRLILSGQTVWAVDVHTGQPAWPGYRVGFADAAGQGYGRPVLSQDFLYWPTRDEILRIDHRDGQIAERIRLREEFGQSGGNLAIADGKLLIAQADRLIALGAAPDEPKPDESPERRKTQPLQAAQTMPPGQEARPFAVPPSRAVPVAGLRLRKSARDASPRP